MLLLVGASERMLFTSGEDDAQIADGWVCGSSGVIKRAGNEGTSEYVPIRARIRRVRRSHPVSSTQHL